MKNSTRIAVILDRSGSMTTIKHATIEGYNSFLRGQKAVVGECTLKFVRFDDVYEEVFDGPINEAPYLDNNNFIPRSSTALRDAIGRTVNSLGGTLSALPESERPNQVIVVIVTDGEENSSREYSQREIADLITRQRETYNWQFVFLGANQDAIMTAKSYSIPISGTMTYNASRAGTRSMYASLGRAVSSSRETGATMDFNSDDRKAALTND